MALEGPVLRAMMRPMWYVLVQEPDAGQEGIRIRRRAGGGSLGEDRVCHTCAVICCGVCL